MEAKRREARETLGIPLLVKECEGIACGMWWLPWSPAKLVSRSQRTGLEPVSQIPDSALSGSAQLGGEGHCDPWSPPLSSGQNIIHLNESNEMEGRTGLLPRFGGGGFV